MTRSDQDVHIAYNIFPTCDLYIQWNTYSLLPAIEPDIVY